MSRRAAMDCFGSDIQALADLSAIGEAQDK